MLFYLLYDWLPFHLHIRQEVVRLPLYIFCQVATWIGGGEGGMGVVR
jgi:hypothetical protein